MRIRITGNFVHTSAYRQGDEVDVENAEGIGICRSGAGEAIDDAARAVLAEADKPKRQAAARPRAKARGAHGRT